jgi:plasmid maintenance system antidote protein VapI
MEIQGTDYSVHTTDFRFILQNELLRRCKKNSAYSIRAFAQSLGIDHSTLSQIIRGKRKLTNKMISKLGQSLDLPPHQLKRFQKNELPKASENYEQLAEDTFIAISDWYHFAILELIHTKNFKQDTKWIAKALGLTVSEVHIAIERLQRLSLLTLDEDGKYIDNAEFIDFGHDQNTAAARKKWQQQTFELALKKLKEVSYDKRSHSGITMAIDSSKIEGARDLIREFRRRLREYLSDSDNCDQVYHLGIALFPLTDIKTDINYNEEEL